VRYCDEVWTGIEYQVAAHAIIEGEVETGLRLAKALRDRYDGSRRNPYNEIECGDHYSRAMAGWSLLEALTGVRYNGLAHALKISPAGSPELLQAPVVFGDGWGTLCWQMNDSGLKIDLICANGRFIIKHLSIGNQGGDLTAELDGRGLAVTGDAEALDFGDPVTVNAGSILSIRPAR